MGLTMKLRKNPRNVLAVTALVVVLAAGPTLLGCSSSETDGSGNAQQATSSASGGGDVMATAESLVGQKLTRDEIDEKLGPCDDFQMSSEGCERGVYAGIFKYDGFTMYTRTYDKGATFTVVSVSQ